MDKKTRILVLGGGFGGIDNFVTMERLLGRDLIDNEAQSLTVDPTGDPEGLLAVLAAEFQSPTSS